MFPPVAILGKVVEKLKDYPFNRIILIAPGWPNIHLALGPGGQVEPNPIVHAQPTQSVDSTIQSDLFQDRKLQPSTIDGYIPTIADKLANVSKDGNLI